MKKIIISWVYLFCPLFFFGQTEYFGYAYDNIYLNCYFDPKLYSYEMIQNSYVLSNEPDFFSLDCYKIKIDDKNAGHQIYYSISDGKDTLVDSIVIDTLDRVYNRKHKFLAEMKLPDSAAWDSIRNARLQQMDYDYYFNRIFYKALSDPSALKEFKFKDSCLSRYESALLQGGDSLMLVWREMYEDQEKVYSKIMLKYHREAGSVNKYCYAQFEVLSDGWRKCAEKYYPQAFYSMNLFRQQEFEKLFVNIWIAD